MGSICSKDSTVHDGQLGNMNQTNLRVSQDATLVFPDFKDIKALLKQKTNQMDLDITRSERGSKDPILSLVLPACRSIPSTTLIRYFLVYSFYIAKYTDKKGNKKDYQNQFFQLLEQSSTEPKQKQMVQNFKKEIIKQSNDAKQSINLLKCAFQHTYLIESLNKILLLSRDPKDLAYFIFPIYSLHNGIKIAYHKSSYCKKKDNIWIIAVLSDSEINFLKKMEGQQNYFFFSAFIRGFTKEDQARQQFKQVNQSNKNKTFLFTVNFNHQYSLLNQAQNNGYYIYQNPTEEISKLGDVVFNIMSSFKVNEKVSKFQYDLDYGYLAALQYKKQNDRDYGKEPLLLKLYELCRGVSKYYLKSQSCLFRIISNNDQSLGVSQLILSGSKTANISFTNDIQRQNLVNTHIEKGDYDEALKRAEEGNTLIFKAKKIQILYEKNKKDEAKEEIAKISEADKKRKENFESRLIIDLIAARIEMGNSQYKKAQERLKNLYEALKKMFPQDFEYISRDVVKSLIECQKRGGPSTELQKTQREGHQLYTGLGGTALQLSSLSVKAK